MMITTSLINPNLIPRGECYLWRSDVLWLQVISESLIALSYFVIPAILIYFLILKKNIPYRKLIFMLVFFISACGLTHVMGIWTIWKPDYVIEGLVNACAAVISVVTACLLLPVIPKFLKLRDPNEIYSLNKILKQQILEKELAQENLKNLNSTLEKQVRIRTNELIEKNHDLLFYKELVQSSLDAIISNTPEGFITTWNKTAESMYGYTEKEMIGQHITKIVSKDSEEFKLFNEALKNGEGYRSHEVLKLKKNGESIPVSLSMAPIKNEKGVLIGFSSIQRDITERKKLEKDLEEKVANLNRIDKKKDEFLTILSHEIRNPLAAIRSSIEFLIEASKSSATQEHTKALSILQRQSDIVNRLVDDLLELSRFQRGKFDIKKTNFDLKETLLNAYHSLESLLLSKNQVFTLDLPEHPIPFFGDEVRIEQVIDNLLHNAIKYTPPHKGIRLAISERNGQVEIILKDEGIGIRPSLLTKIFDIYVQEENIPKESSRGLGIGLTMVKHIVELHSGTIEAFSEGIGKGSMFVVTLPSVAPKELFTPPPPTPLPPPEVSFEGFRVLIVEDNPDTAEMHRLRFEKWGISALIANTAKEAEAYFQEFSPALALIDLSLPDGDGVKLMKKLKRINKTTTFAALTGFGNTAIQEKTRRAGFAKHFIKPVKGSDLKNYLTEVYNHFHQNS